jgi:hypothetical protein
VRSRIVPLPVLRYARSIPPDTLASRSPTGALLLAHFAVVALFVWCIGQLHNPQTGFTSLIGFGDMFEAGTVASFKALPRLIAQHSSGYDGQFYVQMATDPFLQDPATDRAMDDAPLRARRILFAWTAYILGLGRPGWILQAYALQNVVCWLFLSVLLLRWFPIRDGRTFALWCATLFSGGLIWSVRLSLLDGPSLLLLALGMWALERGRRWLSAGIFGLAGLGRETNLLAAAAQVRPDELPWRSIARQAAQAAIVVLPLVIWFDYIYSIHRERIYTTGETLSPPLIGFIWKWRDALAGLSHTWTTGSVVAALSLIALSVQAAFLLSRPAWKDPWWRLGLAYAALMAVLGQPLWAGEPATAIRVLLPMTLAFNVLLRRCERAWSFWPLFVGGNLTVIQAVAMLQVPWVSTWL